MTIIRTRLVRSTHYNDLGQTDDLDGFTNLVQCISCGLDIIASENDEENLLTRESSATYFDEVHNMKCTEYVEERKLNPLPTTNDLRYPQLRLDGLRAERITLDELFGSFDALESFFPLTLSQSQL